MSKVKAAIVRTTSEIEKWYKDPQDFVGVYTKMMVITKNNFEVSREAADWCEKASVGDVYKFKEGYINIEEE